MLPRPTHLGTARRHDSRPSLKTQEYTTIAEIKAAPSVAAVLSLTFENFAQKPGGPVFALFQLESGPPRFLLVETEATTTTGTGHEFARHENTSTDSLKTWPAMNRSC
eukprot:COSAG01_NODE_654_length_14482_cov_20.826347_6_plen_108_part_00